MVNNFSVTNENKRESAIYIGAPPDVGFEMFSVGMLKHAILPGSNSAASKGLAIFQEAVINGISIVHIQIRSETARTVRIKSVGPVLALTFVMHGNPVIQWSNLPSVQFNSGQFNLYAVRRHIQTMVVEPGITDIVNIQITPKQLLDELDFQPHMEPFLNQLNQGKPVQYLRRPIYGSPKQQYSIFQLLMRLCKQKKHQINRDELLDQLLACSIQELESPDLLGFSYEETEALADVLEVFSEYFSVPNIYKKEMERISMHRLRFDRAFLQACGCTAEQFIRNAQMKMAKRMLEESLPVNMVIRSIGYKNRIQQFNRDFLAYFGVALSQFIRSYEGKPW